MKRILFRITENVEYYEFDDEYVLDCFKNQIDQSSIMFEKYLEDSSYYVVCMNHSKCLFTNDRIDHWDTWRSDGSWIWSSELEYYSKNFNFVWPKEFMADVIAKNFKNPQSGKREVEDERFGMGFFIGDQTKIEFPKSDIS